MANIHHYCLQSFFLKIDWKILPLKLFFMDPSIMETFVLAVGILVLVSAAVLALTYNRLITLDERCNSAMCDIDVHLKHRHAVIPNLVQTVRGFAGHERAVIESVSSQRAEALARASDEAIPTAEMRLSFSLDRLIALADTYPELQSSDHFRDLRAEITDAEAKIAASRRFYNLAVREYNATLRGFPGVLVAPLLRLTNRRGFDIGIDRVLLDEPTGLKI